MENLQNQPHLGSLRTSASIRLFDTGPESSSLYGVSFRQGPWESDQNLDVLTPSDQENMFRLMDETLSPRRQENDHVPDVVTTLLPATSSSENIDFNLNTFGLEHSNSMHSSTNRIDIASNGAIETPQSVPNGTFSNGTSPHPTTSQIKKHTNRHRNRRKRLPQESVAILENWISSNQQDPYPSTESKKALAKESKLTEKQISTWLTNYRKRHMDVTRNSRQMTPMEAWLSSSSEDEAASKEDIQRAAKTIPPQNIENLPRSPPGETRVASFSTTEISMTMPPAQETPSLPLSPSHYAKIGERMDGSQLSMCLPMAPPSNSFPIDAGLKNETRDHLWRACDGCRLKKVKCDGLNPCNICQRFNKICVRNKKKIGETSFPTGYVEILERQQHLLVAGIQKLYALLVAGESLPGSSLPEAEDKLPLTHDILERLNLLNTAKENVSPHESFEEDMERMQGKLIESGNTYQKTSYARSLSASSGNSAFSQCEDAVWSGPPRRGRRKDYSYSSSEERERRLTSAQSRRKAQNRAAQRAFRKRIERRTRELETKELALNSSTSIEAIPNEAPFASHPFASDLSAPAYWTSDFMDLMQNPFEAFSFSLDSTGLEGSDGRVNDEWLNPFLIDGDVTYGLNLSKDNSLGGELPSPFNSDLMPLGDISAVEKCNNEEAAVVEEATKYHPSDKYQCTFCHKTLTGKTWKRHEETMHLPREQWVCMPLTSSLHQPWVKILSNNRSCIFCGIPDPDEMHASTHHTIAKCLGNPVTERTFQRKDHLVQHLKNFHDARLPGDLVDSWKTNINYSQHKWVCGFCGDSLADWSTRARHISKHFRDGLDMSMWDSGRGLPEADAHTGLTPVY